MKVKSPHRCSRIQIMSRMGDWMIDMEEHIGAAVQSGAQDEQEVLEYVQKNMQIVDRNFIKEKYREIEGEL